MPTLELEILVHQNTRIFMREQGMTAAQAYEAAVSFILERFALDAETPEHIGVLRTRLAELRESIVAEYSRPQPDLRDLDAVAKAHQKCRRRHRRQLGRP